MLFSASLSPNLSSNKVYSFYWTAFGNEKTKQRRQTVAAESLSQGEAAVAAAALLAESPWEAGSQLLAWASRCAFPPRKGQVESARGC